MEEFQDGDGNKVYLVGRNVFPAESSEEDLKNVDIKRLTRFHGLRNFNALRNTKSKPRFQRVLEKIRYCYVW